MENCPATATVTWASKPDFDEGCRKKTGKTSEATGPHAVQTTADVPAEPRSTENSRIVHTTAILSAGIPNTTEATDTQLHSRDSLRFTTAATVRPPSIQIMAATAEPQLSRSLPAQNHCCCAAEKLAYTRYTHSCSPRRRSACAATPA